MKYPVHIADVDQVFDCDVNESLLAGLLKSPSKAISVGCRGGGCGVCKVQIESGEYEVGKMARCHVTEAEQAEGVVLACRVYPRGPIRLKVLGKVIKCVKRAA